MSMRQDNDYGLPASWFKDTAASRALTTISTLEQGNENDNYLPYLAVVDIRRRL